MTSRQCMCDITGAPTAWIPAWIGPHEGGMTLAMKYAWANALDGVSASKSVCGKSLVQNYVQRLHGRSFLTTEWARVVRPDARPTIGALIARQDMNRYAGLWSRRLASDIHFRFCRECIQHGYQSLLYQVDALTWCPVHRTPLLSACHRCGAPTPRYALTAETMANPFCCPTCGGVYGEKFDPRDWQCTGLQEQVGRALLPLVRFLRRTDRSSIDWLHWGEWFGPWLGEVEQRERRITTFAVLQRIVTQRVNEWMCTPTAQAMSVLRGRGFEPTAAVRVGARTEPQSYRQIYKAIRRHLIKRLPRHVGRSRLLNPQANDIYLQDGMLRLSLKKCPFLQAVWLWRIRFEQLETVVSFHSSQYGSLSLREAARNWPWQGAGDEAVWAHYVLTGFHAAAEIVCEWWGKSTTLAASSGTASGRARLMELHMEFANLLSPSRMPVPPRIAAVFCPGTPQHGGLALYVIGPKVGLEELLACCICDASRERVSDGIASAPAVSLGNAQDVGYPKTEVR